MLIQCAQRACVDRLSTFVANEALCRLRIDFDYLARFCILSLDSETVAGDEARTEHSDANFSDCGHRYRCHGCHDLFKAPFLICSSLCLICNSNRCNVIDFQASSALFASRTLRSTLRLLSRIAARADHRALESARRATS